MYYTQGITKMVFGILYIMNYNLKLIRLSLLLSLITSNLFGQENPFNVPENDKNKIKDAEIIFDNFHKFGLSLQSHYLPFYNRSTYSFVNEYPDRITWGLGLDYNFLQLGKFNFRLGAYVRNFGVADKLKIPYNLLPGFTDNSAYYERTITDSPYWNYNTNLSFEYINFIAKNVAFNFHIGPELMYYATSVGVQAYDSISINDLPVRQTVSTETENDLTFDVSSGFGVYYRIGKTIVRANLNAKFSLSGPIFTEGHEWVNLNDVDGRQIGNHGWDGHHFSFSFTIHPGRKNIKDRLRNLKL